MSKTVVVIRDPFDLSSWERHETEGSVSDLLFGVFDGTWPTGARLYAGTVAQSCDVTPQTAEQIEALETIDKPLFAVVHPQDPITIIAIAVAVIAVGAAIFLRPALPNINNQARSPNNELAERTNQARPNGRVADIYGQVRSTPDLLAVPYKIFQNHQEIEVAYMIIGRGEYLVEDVRDDLTLLSTIPGASVEVYGPGTSPNLSGAVPQLRIGAAINRPVETVKRIASVNGQTLDPSVWVGPFSVALRSLNKIIVNIVAPQGMFKDDGDQISTSVAVEVEVTPLDNSGLAAGAPVVYSGTVVGSATTRDTRAITIYCDVPAGGYNKANVRVRRTTPKDTTFDGSVVDEVKWRDCYGVAPVTKTEFGDVTTVQSLTYATEGALSLKERKLNMLVTRKLPARTGPFAFNGALTPTKDAAHIFCLMAADPTIGRMPLGELNAGGQIDVPQIYQAMADVEAYFGIPQVREFSYTFDDANLSFQEMAQIVAMAVFSEPYRRGSVLRLRPELLQPDSVLLFNHRNKVPDSEIRTINFGSEDNHDGVALTYVDPQDDAQVVLYVPQGDNTAVNPLEVDAFGVRTFEQAYLLAWRRWNRLQYHYMTEEFEALQEADLLSRLDRVLLADTLRSALVDGEVLSQNGLTLELSQPVTLGGGIDYTCFLQLPNGQVEAIPVVQGADRWHVVLGNAPSVPLAVSGEGGYCSGFVITHGENSHAAVPALIVEKSPVEGFTVGVSCINYDERYYANDQDFVVEEGEEPSEPPPPTNPGEGTPDPGVSVEILPSSRSTSNRSPLSTSTFTANVSGGAATAYNWGVLSGAGDIAAGQGTASATLRAYDEGDDSEPTTTTFFCDVTVGGVIYRTFCTYQHYNSSGIFYDGIGIEP